MDNLFVLVQSKADDILSLGLHYSLLFLPLLSGQPGLYEGETGKDIET